MIATKHDLEELISVKELAELLGVHRETVYHWVSRGCEGRKLLPTRIGGRLYFTPHAVSEFQAPAEKIATNQ